MTLASDIITAAYRESNLVAIVSTPSDAEVTEALARLNSLVLSTIGSVVGNDLADLTIGGTYDASACCSPYIPGDARLILNLSGATTYSLDPVPYEGQRLAIADAASNLATNHLTLNGNGRQIEGSASVTLSTNGMARQWLYRADTANWVKIDTLASTDQMPLPADYDDYFIVELALRLNPRHGASLSPESQAALVRAKSQIRARYRKPVRPNGPLYGLLHQRCSGLDNSAAFNTGRA